MSSYRYIWRVALIVMTTTAVFGGLVVRLAYLHSHEHDSIDRRIARMHGLERPISVGRGRILDRNDRVFAIDLPACDIMINPSAIKSEGVEIDLANKLAAIMDKPIDEVYLNIKSSDRRGLRILRFGPAEIEDAVALIDDKFAWTNPVIIRNYPHDRMLCHILGFVNWEGQPGGGLEQHFHKMLQGRDGLLISKKDGRRNELYGSRRLEIAPLHGADIVLTIDQNLQEILEKSLDLMIAEHNPEGAWGVMQNVRTGEIMAMASRPAFDPNNFRHSSSEERRNRVLSFVYEPGSTFKPLVVAAALNEKLVGPDDLFFCEDGRWLYKGRYLRDTHSYGELTVGDIVKKSSNIGTAKIALELGEERLEEYLRAFGLGSKSQIELPGEEAGILHSHKNWSAISTTRLAMGHEIAVTALQMLNAISATVNGGYLMRPTIVKKIINSEGETIFEARPEVVRRVITSQTSALIREMMTSVIEDDGTGRRAKIPGYLVGGKTGTAQKPIPGGYSNTEHISSFVGFLPADAPEIAIIVVADNPQPQHYGGVVAAPAFQRVAEQAVRYLNIPPSNNIHFAESQARVGAGGEKVAL